MVDVVSTLHESDNGGTVTLRLGESIMLELYDNAATGYTWSFAELDSDLLDVNETAPEAPSKAVGSGRTRKWVLTPRASGRTRVALKLWRHWEGDGSITNRFSVSVTIIE